MNTRIIKLSIMMILFFGVYYYSEASFTISRPSTHNLGLVGHWTFDGKNVVSGVALDSSGNGNNGNLINIATSTFYAIGKIGQGFNFDGVNDYVSLGDPASLQITGAMTISAWVRFGNTDTPLDIMTRDGGVSDRGYRFFGESDGTMCFYVATNSTAKTQACTTTTRNTSSWYHLVGTYIPSTSVNIYLDGAFNNSDTTSVPASQRLSTATPRIGSRGDNTSYFKTVIDDVRVYNRALSVREVKALYNQGASKFNKTPTNILNSGLVGHWTFDGKNVVSGVALDSSGNGNNGNLINIATSTFYAIGKIGQGFNFDGVNDYAKVTTVAGLPTGASARSIGFWAWVDSGAATSANYAFAYGARNVNFFFGVAAYPAGNWWFQGIGAADINTGVAVELGKWTYVTVTYDGITLKFYIDGVLVASGVRNFNTSSSSFFFGNSDVLTEGFKGILDELFISNRALSASEVKMLYNMGR